MVLKFYSTGCPKCRILKSKMDAKNLEYETITDTQLMLDMGIYNVPMLEKDGQLLSFKDAVDWVNELGE